MFQFWIMARLCLDRRGKKEDLPKGQLISKPIYDLLTSPKKRTDEFDLFAVKSKKANKSNSSVHFFGEVSRS